MNNIVIDFGTRQIINGKIEAIQGDNTTKKVKILLKENSLPYNLEGKSVMLTMKKNSSNNYVNKGDFLKLGIINAINGEIELPIDKNFTKEKGGYQLQLSVLNEGEFEENSILFEAVIYTNLKEEVSGTLVESVIFKEIKQTLQTVKDIAKNEKERQEYVENIVKPQVAKIDRFDSRITDVENGVGLKDKSVLSSKTTDVGTQAILSLKGNLKIDYVAKKYTFPDNTSGMLFYKNKRYDIPRGLVVELVDQYYISSLWFNTTTKTFVSRGYTLPSILEDEILICTVNNGYVQSICDVIYNGQTYKAKGLKIGYENIEPLLSFCDFYTEGIFDFNYNKNKISIPDTTLFINRETLKINAKEIPLLPNQNQFLIFNYETKDIEIISVNIEAPINYAINNNIIILAIFNRACTNVITRLPHIKNGVEYEKTDVKLKDYYLKENEKIENNLLNETSGDFTFSCITDIHENEYFDSTQEILAFNKLSLENLIDFRFCFGDIVNGFKNKDNDYRDIKKVVSLFKKAGNDFCIARGNHDTGFLGYTNSVIPDNPKLSDVISQKAWDSLTCTHLDDRVVFDEKNSSGGYYYIDFKKYKIRVVVLNSSDCDILNEEGKLLVNPMDCYFKPRQIEWFGKNALGTLDKNYGLIVISHANLDTRGDASYGSKEIQQIITACKNGTKINVNGNHPTISQLNFSFDFDFTQQGTREIIACFSGHSHYDRILEKDTIKYISINNAVPIKTETQYVPEDAETFDRTKDTLTEASFDICRIDRKNKKIFLKRFGAGRDREILY